MLEIKYTKTSFNDLGANLSASGLSMLSPFSSTYFSIFMAICIFNKVEICYNIYVV